MNTYRYCIRLDVRKQVTAHTLAGWCRLGGGCKQMGWIRTDGLLPALINVDHVGRIYAERETGEDNYHWLPRA